MNPMDKRNEAEAAVKALLKLTDLKSVVSIFYQPETLVM